MTEPLKMEDRESNGASKQKKSPTLQKGEWGNKLAATYSHTAYRRTTIGATAFHFRVRDGTGWCHCAMTTRIPARLSRPS